MSNISGAIFPILPENVKSLFDEKKEAFVKFTKFLRLERGSKIVFYTSGKLIGEGTIERIERMEPQTAWIRYKSQIFLTKDQYDNYVVRSPISGEERRTVAITILFLKRLKKYNQPLRMFYSTASFTHRNLQRLASNFSLL
ncbi:MAG: DUF365 domain-containing protein [Candidatus Bathyarchaeota archaeon]|nr:DUF365 domain-containing protein [Candidatus Bathyarchaeota archaeon]MDH5494376.1 DUF365 domain-containing protein [Candidatus Bathyarchaeota archaeon]